MDTNLVLFWMTVAVCGSVAVRALRARGPGMTSFIVIPTAVVLSAVAVSFVYPGAEGFVAAGLCGVFVFLPPLSMRWAFQLATRRRFRAARALARIAPFLHPSPAFRELPGFVGTLERLERGDVDERELRASSRNTPLARFAYAQLLRAHGNWDELLAFVGSLPLAVRSTEPSLGYLHLRALGELGRIDEMLAEYSRLETLPAFAASRDLLRLPIASRLGRVDLVERLLAGRMASTTTVHSAAYWRASTLQAAGRRESAAALAALTQSPDVETRRAATRTLATPLPVIDEAALSPRARDVLRDLTLEVDSAAGLDAAGRPAKMTWLIVASLFA
ncbi:MAG TPA: hypothetical protein VH062_29040, partial [Polyangiaceae bacterium]|nr:hypothetical protein [Polyangiaceae bacterium]